MAPPVLPDDIQRGLALLRAGRANDALPLLEEGWRRSDGSPAALHPLAGCLQRLGRADAALALYQDACARAPKDAALKVACGRAAMLAGRPGRAAAWLQEALGHEPGRADASTLLAQVLRERGEAVAAADLLAPLAAAADAPAELVWEYAQCAWSADRIDAAAEAYRRYARLRPGSAAADVALGRFCSARGDFPAAVSAFEAALAREPGNAAAWWELVNARRAPLTADEASRLAAAEQAVQAPGQRMLLADALARHHDRNGAASAAAGAMARANAAHRVLRQQRGMHYDPVALEREVDVLIRFFDAPLMQRLAGAGVGGHGPLFVFGIPRSGTTLLEQLLGAHPRIAGIGEPRLGMEAFQRAFVACGGVAGRLSAAMVGDSARIHLALAERRREALAPARAGARTVDSQPDNYFRAGWLALAFPDATLIHCLRDPRDVALSCWSNQFTHVGWSFELDHIAHRIEQHRRLLAHFRGLLGPRLLEVRYEALAATPEAVLRPLLSAVGLPWDDAVLQHSGQPTLVRNASQVQVREPVNTRSVGRWQRYREVLAPVLERLDAVAAADAARCPTSASA